MENIGRDAAKHRIQLELQQKTGVLDLGNLGLTDDEIPDELWGGGGKWEGSNNLEHVEVLNLGAGWHDPEVDVHPYFGSRFRESTNHGPRNSLTSLPSAEAIWQRFPNLKRFSIAAPGPGEFMPIEMIPEVLPPNLRSLDLSGASISGLSFLANLQKLEYLDLNESSIASLDSLPFLENLIDLNLHYTRIASTQALTRLPNLQKLDLSYTRINALDGLIGLKSLRSLSISGTPVESLVPICRLSQLALLDVSGTSIESLDALPELYGLRQLNASILQIHDVSPISALEDMVSLNLSNTRIRDLQPLARLSKLRHLDVSATDVVDLSPLSCCAALEELDAVFTQICDVPFWLVMNLNVLYLGDNSELAIPSHLIPGRGVNCIQALRGLASQRDYLNPEQNLRS